VLHLIGLGLDQSCVYLVSLQDLVDWMESLKCKIVVVYLAV
jgi:hypothetical protein